MGVDDKSILEKASEEEERYSEELDEGSLEEDSFPKELDEIPWVLSLEDEASEDILLLELIMEESLRDEDARVDEMERVSLKELDEVDEEFGTTSRLLLDSESSSLSLLCVIDEMTVTDEKGVPELIVSGLEDSVGM